MITLFKQFIQNPLLWWSYSSTVMNPLGLSEEGKNNMNSVWKHLRNDDNTMERESDSEGPSEERERDGQRVVERGREKERERERRKAREDTLWTLVPAGIQWEHRGHHRAGSLRNSRLSFWGEDIVLQICWKTRTALSITG